MKWKSLLLSTAALVVLAATPAYAMDYSIDGPGAGDFGAPTSDNTIYETADPNVDRSKNSALIPPGFGTPTSYLPGSGEYLTPNLAAGGPLNSPSLTGTITVGGGTEALPGAVDAPLSSYPTSGYPTTSAPVTAYTEVTSGLYYKNGSLGTLKIPAIGLSVQVVQGTDSAALAKGAGHFTNTSIWDGNVALAGHNRGVTNHFGKIHTLNVGDMLIDIQAKMRQANSPGFERWAKIFNLKEMAKTVMYLQEKGLTDFGELEKACDAAAKKFNGLSDRTKAASARMKDISELQKHVGAYIKTREIYAQYRKLPPRKQEKFYNEHSSEIRSCQAAKRYFDSLGLKKLPSIQSLKQEYAMLQAENKKRYPQQKRAREEMIELLTAKNNVERILGATTKGKIVTASRGRDDDFLSPCG